MRGEEIGEGREYGEVFEVKGVVSMGELEGEEDEDREEEEEEEEEGEEGM